MTLIVETGVGLADAESYISVVDADIFHARRGREATWSELDTAVKEVALRLATEFMEQIYRARWKGVRMQATQALSWPRAYVYTESFLHGAVGEFPYLVPDDVVPVEVKRACAELAFKSLAEELAPDLERGVKREKIGPLETEYDLATPQSKRFRSVALLLSPYLDAAGSFSIELVRS